MVDKTASYDHMILLSRAKAFHFSSTPPADIRSFRYLNSTEPREVISAVLANAVHGDFTQFDRLAELMKQSDDAVVWGDCAKLYTYVAPYSALRKLVDSFGPVLFQGDDVVTQQWISEILCLSGGLSFVPDVLTIFRRNRERDKYFSTPMYLSRMLEEEPFDIADGPPVLPRTDDLPAWFDVPAVYDDDTFEQRVMGRHAALCAMVSDPRWATVWEGRPLSLQEMAHKALARIEQGQDIEEIALARTWIEAATGQDLSDWYSDCLLQPLNAAASVESLLESRALEAFTPGYRYFFGRKIPN
jgi:hypothetical protein